MAATSIPTIDELWHRIAFVPTGHKYWEGKLSTFEIVDGEAGGFLKHSRRRNFTVLISARDAGRFVPSGGSS